LSGEQLETTFLPQGEALDAGKNQTTPYNAVGVDFFNTLGIPMLAGRPFNEHDTTPSPQLFIPYAQQTQVRRLTYIIRTQVAPETIVPALRKVLQAADPALPLVRVRTQQAQIDEDLADERLLVSLSS